MKIYFGHSRMTYGTKMEEKAIEIIMKHYPGCEIINPNIPKHQTACNKYISKDSEVGKEMGYFHKLTHDTEIGCFFQYYHGNWSAGTASEAHYMQKAGKRIFQINIDDESITEIVEEINSFSFQETRDKLHKAGLTHYK
jgi:hypothetical protein